jgi:cytochrome c
MKRSNLLVFVIVMAISAVLTAGSVLAQEKAPTRAQAQELLNKVKAHAKTVGCEKAFVEFSNPKSTFNTSYGKTYITAGDAKGITLAHGLYPIIVGQNHSDVKDAEGKPFVRQIQENLKKSNHSDIEYKWNDTKLQKVVVRHQMTETFDCGGSLGVISFSVVYP